MMNILLIEDDIRLAGLIHKGLEELGYKVVEFHDAESAEPVIGEFSWDLVITDVMLPGKNGFEFCRTVKAVDPGTPVIMLTALGETDDKLGGFDAGADDYMVKPFDIRELHARIKVLTKRSSAASVGDTPKIIEYCGLRLDPVTMEVQRDGRMINLTPKEFNLLKFLLENRERVVSRTEISEKVWDTHFDTGTNFIDVYINYLRKKIDRDYPEKLIHTRQGMGFILKKM